MRVEILSSFGNIAGKIKAALLIGMLLLPGGSHALELGLTPSHVLGLWTNINATVVALLKETHPEPDFIKSFSSLQTGTFDGKRPADVFGAATRQWDRLQRSFNLADLPPTPAWIEQYQALETRADTTAREITPSQVFVLSSQILNRLVMSVVDLTDGTRPISEFYVDYSFGEKVPSDVYAQVDLLGRRLDLLALHVREYHPIDPDRAGR
ncbi:MAG: hypothetical protein ACPGOV_15005 [Magnetovibrionaceae bacterium]